MIANIITLVCGAVIIAFGMNERNEARRVLVTMLGMVFLLLGGMFLAVDYTEKNYKVRAIEAGVAEYVIDSDTGKSSFEWKPCAKQEHVHDETVIDDPEDCGCPSEDEP